MPLDVRGLTGLGNKMPLNLKTINSKLKSNGITILVFVILILLTFSPDAKSWLLQQLVSVGLFKAEIKKEGIEKFPFAATFRFTNTKGITASTADLKGKVLFINFWASWCPPCRAEMPSIVTLYRKLQCDNRYVFLFMNEEEDKTKATQFLEKNQYSIPLYNRAGNVPDEIFSGTLPTTLVISKEGKIVFKQEGIADYDTEGFIKQLKELL